MTTFRCRMMKPTMSEWETVEAASSGEAANDFHERNTDEGLRLKSFKLCPDPNKPAAHVHLALIEVEGIETLISRVFTSCIGRKGGVHGGGPTLEQVAKELGWTGDPQELFSEDGWEGVESEDDAWRRRRREKHLFTLLDSHGNKHPVLLAGDYGAVCPGLWTTNGNLRECAQRTIEHITPERPDDQWVYTVQDSILPPEAFQSVEALHSAIKTEYEANRK